MDPLALLKELVHTELEYRLRWRRGTYVESYFRTYPQLAADAQTALELILAEYRLRLHLGHLEATEAALARNITASVLRSWA